MPPFWAFLGLFAYPTPRGLIVGLTPCKNIVLSNKHIPQSVFGPDPPRPPPLETHFLELLREVGGVGGQRMTPPFFGSKIMNLLVFFSILSQKKRVSGF